MMVDRGAEVPGGWKWRGWRGIEGGTEGHQRRKKKWGNLRDRSCLLLCSDLLKALAQYVHLYLRSCASGAFRVAVDWGTATVPVIVMCMFVASLK